MAQPQVRDPRPREGRTDIAPAHSLTRGWVHRRAFVWQANGRDPRGRHEAPAGGLFRAAYVDPKNMDALKSYAYRGVDHSFVSNYIMQPYWSRLVHLFPRWMAYAGAPGPWLTSGAPGSRPQHACRLGEGAPGRTSSR